MDWFRNYMGRWNIKQPREVSLVPEGGYPIDDEKEEDEPLWPKENPYVPSKIWLIGARGNGKSTISVELATALIRADVYQYADHIKQQLHFVSKNTDAPLTDREKTLLSNSLGIHMCPYEVIFDN